MRKNSSPVQGGSAARLLGIMVRLRDPVDGCEWDKAQDFASIAPYTIEEAYEVADAIARDDMSGLCDELGDLLLQVVFHARMAEERGSFAFDDVVTAICEKMERRHPHIFGDDPAEASPGWEAIKAQERGGGAQEDPGALAGVAMGLPALMRAQKLQKRAARVGFDWPDTASVRAKVDEEMEELALAATPAERQEEAGDLLFAMVNLIRHMGMDAEEALRAANRKFERRFADMEAQCAPDISRFATLSLEEKEALWQAAKVRERE